MCLCLASGDCRLLMRMTILLLKSLDLRYTNSLAMDLEVLIFRVIVTSLC